MTTHAAQQIVKDQGLCGELVSDGLGICLLTAGHGHTDLVSDKQNPAPNLDTDDTEMRLIIAQFYEFAENWNVPATPGTLKMYVAFGLAYAMMQGGVTAIGDELWESYYERFLKVTWPTT